MLKKCMSRPMNLWGFMLQSFDGVQWVPIVTVQQREMSYSFCKPPGWIIIPCLFDPGDTNVTSKKAKFMNQMTWYLLWPEVPKCNSQTVKLRSSALLASPHIILPQTEYEPMIWISLLEGVGWCNRLMSWVSRINFQRRELRKKKKFCSECHEGPFVPTSQISAL